MYNLFITNSTYLCSIVMARFYHTLVFRLPYLLICTFLFTVIFKLFDCLFSLLSYSALAASSSFFSFVLSIWTFFFSDPIFLIDYLPLNNFVYLDHTTLLVFIVYIFWSLKFYSFCIFIMISNLPPIQNALSLLVVPYFIPFSSEFS